MPNKYSVENHFVIQSTEAGKKKGHVEVGCDRDGLDLIQIRAINEEGQVVSHLNFTAECGSLLGEAINRVILFKPKVPP